MTVKVTQSGYVIALLITGETRYKTRNMIRNTYSLTKKKKLSKRLLTTFLLYYKDRTMEKMESNSTLIVLHFMKQIIK